MAGEGLQRQDGTRKTVSGAEKAIKEHKFQDERSINYANYCRCQEGRD